MKRINLIVVAALAWLLSPFEGYARQHLALNVGVPAASGHPAYSGTFIPAWSAARQPSAG